MSAADASPLEWEGLTGVPLDTNDNVSFILFGSPTFAKIDDLLGGMYLHIPFTASHFLTRCPVFTGSQEPYVLQHWACAKVGLEMHLVTWSAMG